MSFDLTIRPAMWEDVPAIADIYNEAIEERSATCHLVPRSLEDRQEWFRQFDERHPIWVGEFDGVIVCYGCLMAYNVKPGYRYATEHSVYVASRVRGRGAGRAMLEYLVSEAKRLGYHYMEGGVFAHNEASLALHQTLGFEVMGIKREVANLDGQWRDVVLMVKLL